MGRRIITIAVLLVCGGLLAWRHGPRIPKADPDQANAAVLARLHEPVELTVDGESLSAALTKWSCLTQIPLEIDPRVAGDLEQSKTLQTAVYLPAMNLTAESAIHSMLRLSGDLHLVVKHGKVIVTSPQDREQPAHFVGQVHVLPANLQAVPGIDSDDLCHIIREAVEPDSWRMPSGRSQGTKADLWALPGALAVVHCAETQWQIAQLLETLADVHRDREQQAPRTVGSPGGSMPAALRRKLEERSSVRFDGVDLNAFVDHFRSQHDLPLMLDARAIEEKKENDEGEEIVVSAELTDMPLQTLLEQPLRQHELTVSYHRGLLWLTTLRQVHRLPQECVVYPIQDLLSARLTTAEEMAKTLFELTDSRVVVPCGQSLIVLASAESQSETARLLDRLRTMLATQEVNPHAGDSHPLDFVARQLERPVSLHVRQRPLGDVLRELLAAHGLQMTIDRVAFTQRRMKEPRWLKRLVSLDVDHEPLWSVLEHHFVPSGPRWSWVPRSGNLLELTWEERAKEAMSVRLYSFEGLTAQGQLLRRSPSTRPPRTTLEDDLRVLLSNVTPMNYRCAYPQKGVLARISNVLLVRHTEELQRDLRWLLSHLAQLPDQPDALAIVGQDALQVDPIASAPKENDGQIVEPGLIRVYALPRDEKQAPTSLPLAQFIEQQVLAHTWQHAGGAYSVHAVTVDGRDGLVVSQSATGHRIVRTLLYEVMNGSQEVAAENDGAWRELSVPDEARKTPAVSISIRRLPTLRQPFSGNHLVLRDLLERTLPEVTKGGSIFIREQQLYVLGDDVKRRALHAAIDVILAKIDALTTEAGLNDTPLSDETIKRLLLIALNDPDPLRRQTAAIFLQHRVPRQQPLSEATWEVLFTQAKTAKTPQEWVTILRLTRSDPTKAVSIYARPVQLLASSNNEPLIELTEALGEQGSTIVPLLCEWIRQLPPRTTTPRETRDRREPLWLFQALRNAAQGDASSVRTIIKMHIGADKETQDNIIEFVLFPIDRNLVQAAVHELSQKPEVAAQEDWLEFRMQILSGTAIHMHERAPGP